MSEYEHYLEEQGFLYLESVGWGKDGNIFRLNNGIASTRITVMKAIDKRIEIVKEYKCMNLDRCWEGITK
jgi:hypothetical protein